MMNTRLKQFLSAENITQSQFADTIKVVRASVSHVLSGRNNPSYEFIKAVMQHYPHLNIEWLLIGKGKMYKGNSSAEPVQYDDLFSQINEQTHLPKEADIMDNEEFSAYEMPAPVPVVSNIESSNEFNTLDNPIQNPVKQRNVQKIIILYDDGSFQEM